MIKHVCRTTALLALCLGMAVSLPQSTSGAGQEGGERHSRWPSHPHKVSITTLPRGDMSTIGVSKISARGVVVGHGPIDGGVLRWLPGARQPQDLGGEPMFMMTNRLPLISDNGLMIAATRLEEDEEGEAWHGVPSIWTRWTGWRPLPGLMLENSHVTGMSRNGAMAGTIR